MSDLRAERATGCACERGEGREQVGSARAGRPAAATWVRKPFAGVHLSRGLHVPWLRPACSTGAVSLAILPRDRRKVCPARVRPLLWRSCPSSATLLCTKVDLLATAIERTRNTPVVLHQTSM